jgi:hypothetical protein
MTSACGSNVNSAELTWVPIAADAVNVSAWRIQSSMGGDQSGTGRGRAILDHLGAVVSRGRGGRRRDDLRSAAGAYAVGPVGDDRG